MHKIPVGRTISQAYSFAFGRYLTLLGIIWLPMLASVALTYYLRMPLMEHLSAANLGTGFDPQFQRINFLIQCVGLVLTSIIAVGITKEALGLPRGWRFVYAGFGAAELRVIVGYFALILLFIVFILGFVLGVGIIAGIAAMIARMASGPALVFIPFAVGLLVIAFWFTLIVIFVRMTFLFVPVTVAERRIGILRSWELTHGNFWRIFAIGFVVLLPLIALGTAFMIHILGTDYLSFMMAHAKDPDAIRKHVFERVSVIYQNLPLFLAIGFVINPVIYALIYGPSAFAYRALVPLAEAVVPAPEPVAAAEPASAQKEGDLPPAIEEILEKPSDHAEGH